MSNFPQHWSLGKTLHPTCLGGNVPVLTVSRPGQICLRQSSKTDQQSVQFFTTVEITIFSISVICLLNSFLRIFRSSLPARLSLTTRKMSCSLCQNKTIPEQDSQNDATCNVLCLSHPQRQTLYSLLRDTLVCVNVKEARCNVASARCFVGYATKTP